MTDPGPVVVTVDEQTDVTIDLMKKEGVIAMNTKRVKVVTKGELTKKLTVHAHGVSESAKATVYFGQSSAVIG